MENFNFEGGSKYNFEQFEAIKPAMFKLVKKLKEKIEAGNYDMVISDEVTARIPTLVLRKIINQKSPKEGILTKHVSGGKMFERTSKDKIKPELKSLLAKDNPKSVLLVTEFIESGTSIKAMNNMLISLGVGNVEIASLFVNPRVVNDLMKDENVFFGEKKEFVPGNEVDQIRSKAELYAGVEKDWGYELHPGRLDKVLEGQDDKMSVSERQELRDNIIKSRQDAKTLAEDVINEVWGD